MQDNKDIANIDKQLTDLGWEKMQGILHKEMPIATAPKRRWGWLWLLLLLPSLFILGIMIYFGIAIWQDEKKYNESPDTAIANVIENTKDNDKFEVNKEATAPLIDDFPESSHGTGSRREKPDPTAKVVGTDIPKISTKKELETNIIQNNLYITENNNFINKKTNKTQATLSNDFPESNEGTSSPRRHTTAKVVGTDISEKSPTEHTPPPITSMTKSSKPNSFINTRSIATLSPQIIKNNDAKLQTSPNLDPILKSRKSSRTYSAFVGVRSDEFTGFGGVNAGLLAYYQFMPKVGLEIGLMYANTRKNIRANIDYTNTINQLDPDNTLQYRSDIEDLHTYNYFRLPLSLTYRPYNKIQFGIGLNAGYRFDNIIENTSVANDFTDINSQSYQTVPNYQSEAEINIPDNASLPLADFEQITVPYSLAVRRMDVAAQAGVRYYPTPRLGIDLNYKYGLLNMTPNTSINRNSGIQLALVWQLHR